MSFRVPGWTLLFIAGTLIHLTGTLLLPAALAKAIDALAHENSRSAALLSLSAVLIAEIVGTLMTSIACPASLTATTAWLRHYLFGHALSLGTAGAKRFPAGDMVSRLLDSTYGAAGITLQSIGVIVNLIVSAGSVVALWLVDWTIGFAFVIAAVPVAFSLRGWLGGTTDAFERYQAVQGGIAARMAEAVMGARTIQACGTVDHDVQRVLAPLPELAAAGHSTWSKQRQLSWRSSLAHAGLQLCVLAVAGYGVLHDTISVGEWIAVVAYAAMATGCLDAIDSLVAISYARAGITRLTDVFRHTAAKQVAIAEPECRSGPLVLRDATVRSEGRTIVERADLVLAQGDKVAVVGAAGSGKTGLIHLLGGLIQPDEGEVFLDGIPLNEFPTHTIRRWVSYSFAQPSILGTSIADMISYGMVDPERSAIERVAKLADADSFIRRLPHGYDSMLADAPLSGGEYQRLGLARALIRNPRILILDDATSGLDTITEFKVTSALNSHAADQTRIILARRPATAAHADYVVWLDQGRIRAVGAHHDLWAEQEYRSIFAPGSTEIVTLPHQLADSTSEGAP
ncbi:hypothetical protein ADK75_05370 [Streptomyces virginiae]|uniref:ABC transporter ATP-binding protein n=1 Tax=Streptomyces virginiae TaxID=1961 RepID=A0A0L8N375_STRVG|nr:hypothetical protein ADK75_05370 [Streptomyces virginiae]